MGVFGGLVQSFPRGGSGELDLPKQANRRRKVLQMNCEFHKLIDLSTRSIKRKQLLLYNNFISSLTIACAYRLATSLTKTEKSTCAVSSARSEIVRTAANGMP